MYEDELPEDISEMAYSWWFDRSRVVDGVRVGPIIEQKTALNTLGQFKGLELTGYWIDEAAEILKDNFDTSVREWEEGVEAVDLTREEFEDLFGIKLIR